MTTFRMGDIFTDAEILKAGNLYRAHKGTGDLNTKLVDAIVTPALDRINKQTGQENSAKYLAYCLEYVLNEASALVDKQEPAT